MKRGARLNDKETIHSGIKKIVATILIQVVILVMSFITGFILPKYMGPKMFGYWQIYLFYLAYLNLFGLGFNDGIALFYGGYRYKDLPFQQLQSSMRIFYIYLAAITAVLFLAVSFAKDAEIRGIYHTLALSVPIISLQCVVLTVFLSVNRTGVYNILNLLTKALSTVFILFLLFDGITASRPMMYADFATRFLITIICLVLGRKFLFGKGTDLKLGMQEIKQKSKSGINITLAVIAASFMPVAGRVIVELNEPISVYGMYSFAMSLLTIVIAFTSTAGTVIFPLLKRLQKDRLQEYYRKFSFISDNLIYISLFVYIPAVLIIKYYMKEYLPVLGYIHILLVMCLPLGKIQLLLTSYYKAFRLERSFLIANGAGTIAMLLCTSGAYFIFHSVVAVAACTTIVVTVWCSIAEKYLLKRMEGQKETKEQIAQLALMVMFVLGGSLQNLWIFAAVYGGSLLVYYLMNHKKLLGMVKSFQK